MFYAVEALLLKDELTFSKHSAVISAFAKKYVKTNIFPLNYHRMILDSFELRHIGDYGKINALDKSQSEDQLHKAQEFVNGIEEYLSKLEKKSNH